MITILRPTWIRGSLTAMVEDLLYGQWIKARGLHDPAFISRPVARPAATGNNFN